MAIAESEVEVRPSERRLPAGWNSVRLGDVVRSTKVNADPASAGLDRYVAGEHMRTDDLHIRSWGTVGDGYLGPAFHRRFTTGQVLYGSRRTYLRKVAIAEFDGICANTTLVLEPSSDELLPTLCQLERPGLVRIRIAARRRTGAHCSDALGERFRCRDRHPFFHQRRRFTGNYSPM